ncbi:MAG: short-chain fatty acid transporter [Oscillospiraceae bacterium]|nr:short-chain fatty acid transporter [Oscillospiraceae bacterium]
MFKKLTNGSVKLVERLLPDAFIFCIILTIVVFILAMPLTGQGPMAMIQHWGNGVWGLLAFSMQMALVAVLGNAFATAPAIKRAIVRLAAIPKSPSGAIIMVTAISTVCCWLNWGFGLIVGAILAKEVAKRRNDTDYRLLIASAYSGFVVWHAGLSASIPLDLAAGSASYAAKVGDALEFMEGNTYTLATTVLAPWNLIVCLAILVVMSLVNAKMHPAPKDVVIVDPALLKDEEFVESPKAKRTPAQKMENSPILTYIIVLVGVIYLVSYFAKGGALALNQVNLIFLLLGLAFHVTPIRYVHAIGEGAKGAAGVILQFPFYAGIQGMMVGVSASTGLTLAGVISNALVAISNTVSFPIFAFISAGIVNFFVPSGGSQWAVQGPIIMPAGVQLGVKPEISAMAIAWGDAWTNMAQPFWALPALGVAKLSARDIMGYCIIDLIVSGIIIIIGFLVVGFTGIGAL